MSWGMAAPGAAPTPAAERFVRYVNRDNTLAASIKNQAIVIETTAYTTFEALRDIAMRVVDARAQVSSIVGVERIGLRYVLEIRVPVGRRWPCRVGQLDRRAAARAAAHSLPAACP